MIQAAAAAAAAHLEVMIKVPSNVSIECLEAIELLLKKDKRERITIFEFLHHPWL